MSPPSPTLTSPLLIREGALPSPDVYATPCGAVAIVTRPAPGREGPNEDAIALLPEPGGCVIVVADGVGGAPLGSTASGLAIEAMRDALAGGVDGAAVRDRVLDGFERANAAVMGLGVGAATTLVVAEVTGSTLRCYHAGDSAVVVTGQRGRVKLLTVAHSPVGYGVEAGLIDPVDAMNHDQRHMVSNLVGASDMRVEMGSPLELRLRDTVVVGTDGLFDNLHVEEIVATARKGRLEKIATELTMTCVRRMTEPAEGVPSKPDDLTFAVFRRR